MIYLDEVVIHNFRSFRQQTIKFSKGFNCIVGPNGSGKSSISSAILFSLGETSLKRLDVSSGTDLINYLVKPGKDDKLKRASVKVRFGGDRQIEVLRIVRSDKKVAYRLDGKRTTRQKIVEVLRDAKANINLTNTITQSETKRLLGLNPKERRMLIDVAAGISEFNEKSEAAKKELEKAEEKINITKATLGERTSWLKGLEKDKTDAEAYLELNSKLKRAQFTLLKLREGEVSSGYEAAFKAQKEKTATRQENEKRIADLESQVSIAMKEKERLSSSINAKSAEAASSGRILEELKKNIAVDEAQIESLDASVNAAKLRLAALTTELEALKEGQKRNSEMRSKLEFEHKVKSKNLPDEGKEGAPGGDSSSLAEKYGANNESIEKLRAKQLNFSSEYAKLTADCEALTSEATELNREINRLAAKRSMLSESAKAHKDATTVFSATIKELGSSLAAANAEIEKLQKRQDELFSEKLALQEMLARTGKEGSRATEIVAKAVGRGFYGRADDLCTYDEKYAIAIQAAAGARLSYFVVDSIGIAEKAIGVLKAQKLGRASFIPLEEVKSRETKASAQAKALIDVVKFDKKFERAFSYIFSNTYLVDDLATAQKLGIGERRFVTLEGEVVEPSGIVTGGSTKAALSVHAIDFKLKQVDIELAGMKSKLAEADKHNAEMRQKIAANDTNLATHEMEMKYSLSSEDEVSRQLESSYGRIKACESRKTELSKDAAYAKLEAARLESEIAALKAENTELSARLQKAISGKPDTAKAKEERAKVQSMRQEIEKITVQIATIGKETEMLGQRQEQLEVTVKKEKDGISIDSGKTIQLSKERERLLKQKGEMELELKAHDSKSAAIYKDVQVLEAKIQKVSEEKGKLQYSSERLKDELAELEGRKAQLQTRMNDIKAEMMSYQGIEPMQGAKPDELERQITVSKDQIERLGNVNLKAPEYYAEKKRDVEDAEQKLSTLESERSSILAMIDEISEKKTTVFMDTLNSVNENFKRLYGYIFDGTATLKLNDSKDPFNSGLVIETTSKEFRAETGSGGQKSLLSLMMVFSIIIRNPMAFYIFDEIDASLDPENAKKLSTLIKELSARSQFIVVSHNNSLITEADTAIGVAQNKTNGSQTFGVEIKGATVR